MQTSAAFTFVRDDRLITVGKQSGMQYASVQPEAVVVKKCPCTHC